MFVSSRVLIIIYKIKSRLPQIIILRKDILEIILCKKNRLYVHNINNFEQNESDIETFISKYGSIVLS